MRGIRKPTSPPLRFPLRSKALVLTGAVSSLLLVLLYTLAHAILFDSFVELEKDNAEQSTRRVIHILQDEQAELNRITADWANWDDSYDFIADADPAYIESNLADDTFTTLQISLIMFLDEAGEVVYGKAFPPERDESILLDSPFIQAMISGSGPLSHYRDYTGPEGYVDGLIVTPDGPMLISIQPIRRSDRTGPARGTLIMGRYLDDGRIEYFAQIADVRLALRYLDDPALPDHFKAAADHLISGADVWTQLLNGSTFAGYSLLKDISGSPVLILSVEMSRDMSQQGQETVRFFLLAAALLALTLIGVTAGLVERVVLARVLRLSHAVRQISQSGDPNARVPVSGSDELADLGRYLNDMLSAFQTSQEALWSSEARYRALFENANDAIFLMKQDIFVDCNPRALDMFGCVRDQIINQPPYADRFSPAVQPDGRNSREKANEKINQALTGFAQHFEWRHTRYDGTPFEADVIVSRLDLSGEAYLQVIIHDITERKRAEEALRESEEEFSRLFDRVPVNLYRTTPDGQLIVANPALLELLGYSDLAVLQRDSTVRFYVDPADREMWRTQLERDGTIRSFQTRLYRRDGSIIWVEDTARVVRDRDGGSLYYEGALKDVTERIQAEAEREHLLRQMEIRATQLATVAEISHRITTILDIDTLLWEVSRLIKENFDLYHVHIYLLEGNILKLAAGEGEIGRQLVERGTVIPLDFEHSLVARAARTREVVLVNDVTQEPDFLPCDLLLNSRSEMAIPILIGSELLGVLNVEDDEVNRFTLVDVNVKTTLAAQVAIAIHNARLFTDSARRLAIIENSSDLIALARLDTYEPLYINAAGLRLLGYADHLEDFYAMPLRDHYLAETLDHLQNVVVPAVRAQGFWRGENWIKRRDGTVIPVEQIMFVIPDQDGQPRDLATILIDITTRKQAEKALQQANRAYRVLSDSSQAMVRAVDENALLDEICAIIVNTGLYRFAWVAYADATDPRLTRPLAYAGHEAGYLAVIQPYNADKPPSPCRFAIQTGETQIVRDIASDPAFEPWREAALTRGYCAMIALPLRLNGQVFGSLNVYASEADAFDAGEIALLTELADDLAYGIAVLRTRIERQQAVEQLQQVNARLEKRNVELLALHEVARILTATLDVRQIYQVMYDEVARRLFGAQHFTVALYDAEHEQIVCDFSIVDGEPVDVSQLPPMPLGKGPNSETIRTCEARIITPPARDADSVTPGADIHPGTYVHIGDEREPHSALFVPLISGNVVIGVMNIQHYAPGAFQDADLKLVSTIANQAATAIQNARLFAAEREQRTLAEALHDTIAALNQTLDPDAVLDRILENIQRVVPHDTASIMLIENGMARIVRHIGFAERGLAGKVESLSFSISHMVKFTTMIETGHPMIIGDTQFNPDWVPLAGLEWLHSYIGAPIKRGDQLIGVLNLDSATPNFFTEQNAAYLQVFADQAAIAIHNAQLFAAAQQHAADLQAHTDRLALINRVSIMLAQTLDPQMIFAIALHELQNAMGTQFAGLVLYDPGGETGRLVLDTHPTRRADQDQVIQLKGNASVEWVRREHRPLVSPDVLNDPLFITVHDLLRERGTVSLVVIPLILGDEVFGTIGLDSTTTRHYSEVEYDVLGTIANQVSVAIAKAQLYAAERDQRLFAEALSQTAAAVNSTLDFNDVLDRILEYVGRAIPHDAANIMAIEDGVARVVRSRGYEKYGAAEWLRTLRYQVAEMPSWQDMFQSSRPFAIPDTAQSTLWLAIEKERWIRSTVKAPISIEGEIIGILHLDSATPNTFSQEDAVRLQTFADQAAIAIHNVRLFNAERDQRIFAEALSDTAVALTGSLTLDEVTTHILENIGRVIPHDAANLALIDIELRQGRIVGCRGYEDRGGNERKMHTLTPLNVTGHMVPGRAVIVEDTTKHPQWVDVSGDDWIRSYMGMPVHLDGQIIGILNLDSATPNAFTQAHAARLQAFADQAALAIRSAQLFERVQQYTADLEQRVEERTQELEQQRAQLQAILDSMGEGVIYDENLQVKHTNRALTQLTGYSPSELASRPYLEPLCRATHTPEEFNNLLRQIYDRVDKKGLWRGETRLQRADDSQFDAALTANSVRDAQGEIVGAVTVIRDISQEKALQEQRVRFIANASHELRTPLANIKTRLYLLQRQPEKAEQHIKILNQVADGMAELVENLLDVSRFERGKIPLHRREMDFQELITRVVRVQQADAERKGVALITDLYPTPLKTYVDPQRMTQVITNLVANAINYTPEEGQITVKLKPDGNWAVLSISDTGIGIAPEMIEHIFEPFFRADERAAVGTGLGLTIAREIVHLHGGEISVQSEAGRGSTFTVKITLLDQ